MAIADQTVLSEIQRVTLEGSGDGGLLWPSGMWTAAEVLGYLNHRQNRFLAATGLVWTVLETPAVQGSEPQPAPDDWIATLFIAFKDATGRYVELPKLDVQEIDLILPTWPSLTCSIPHGYYEIDGSTLTTYVVPCPLDAGCALERYYVALGTALTAGGVLFSVPDEFVPTIKYGCLAEMFSKVGQANNPVLAQAAEARWEEGVQVGTLMGQQGWLCL